MREKGAGLVQRMERIAIRQGAAAEAGDLRKHEPHPVAALAARPQLRERVVIDMRLASTKRARSKVSIRRW